MPQEKVRETLDILESDDFVAHQTEFAIGICASLLGKLGWCTLTTPLGTPGCLIRIEQLRRPGEKGTRKVRLAPYRDESEALALAKFMNDPSVRRRFLQAAVANPWLVMCSMVSMVDVTERIKMPGQSKWLVWLSGDFSVKGNSSGIQSWDIRSGGRSLSIQ